MATTPDDSSSSSDDDDDDDDDKDIFWRRRPERARYDDTNGSGKRTGHDDHGSRLCDYDQTTTAAELSARASIFKGLLAPRKQEGVGPQAERRAARQARRLAKNRKHEWLKHRHERVGGDDANESGKRAGDDDNESGERASSKDQDDAATATTAAPKGRKARRLARRPEKRKRRLEEKVNGSMLPAPW